MVNNSTKQYERFIRNFVPLCHIFRGNSLKFSSYEMNIGIALELDSIKIFSEKKKIVFEKRILFLKDLVMHVFCSTP